MSARRRTRTVPGMLLRPPLVALAAAAVVGVSSVEFLDHPDGVIEYGVPLRRDLGRDTYRSSPRIVRRGTGP